MYEKKISSCHNKTFEGHTIRAYAKWFRKLPIAWDRDIKTAWGEGNGPNVMTG